MLQCKECMRQNHDTATLEPDTNGRPQHLSWWPDWEFTNDLLLHPQRPRLTEITLAATAEPLTMDTVLEIQFKVENRSPRAQDDLRVYAVILDGVGIILTRGHAEAMTKVNAIAAGQSQNERIVWRQDSYAQSYHLLLVLEDSSGNLTDVVSGDYVVS